MRKEYISNVLLFVILVSVVNGIPLYMKEIPASLKKCTVCHIQSSGIGGLNNFGFDFAKNNFSLSRIEKLDSDHDGFSNYDELNAGTYPGDPNSYPGIHENERRSVSSFTSFLAVLIILILIFTLYLRSKS
ncbi:MAG: thrombospondin type 3 repeat-containing protein [Candidatus Hydrothermarchaeota archaeon]